MCNVFNFDSFRKIEHPIRCPHCASLAIIRHGKYQRGHPLESRLVAIQRYRCKSPDCPWKTFSLLPYPFLPIVRHFYKTLLRCHTILNRQRKTQAYTARWLGLQRGVVKWMGDFCRKFIPWLNLEKKIAVWGPDPGGKKATFWMDFIRDFSQVFYPKRWEKYSPTQ
jgi:transposase-like protein